MRLVTDDSGVPVLALVMPGHSYWMRQFGIAPKGRPEGSRRTNSHGRAYNSAAFERNTIWIGSFEETVGSRSSGCHFIASRKSCSILLICCATLRVWRRAESESRWRTNASLHGNGALSV